MDLNELFRTRNYKEIEKLVTSGNFNLVNDFLSGFESSAWVFLDAPEKCYQTRRIAIGKAKEFATSIEEFIWVNDNLMEPSKEIEQLIINNLYWGNCIKILKDNKTGKRSHELVLKVASGLAKTVDQYYTLLQFIQPCDKEIEDFIRLNISKLMF